MLKKIIAVLLFISLAGSANASEFLTEAEIKTLFTGHSFDVRNETKGKDLKGFANDKGQHFIHVPWKNKTFKRKWWTDGDKHCTSHPKRGDSCKKMKKVGDGVYHGITDGEHTHTLSNFRSGRDPGI